MFTGLVEEVGTVRRVVREGDGLRICVAAATVLEGTRTGDSIAVDGVCQTIVELARGGFTVQTVPATLARTTLGEMAAGRRVNLERALAVGDRLGGHLVQGHVDGVGRVEAVERSGEDVLLTVALPPEVADITVARGSIALNGVSLTVQAMPAAQRAQVAIVPHTLERTAIGALAAGDRVNLEGDLVGRYVAELLERREGPAFRSGGESVS